MDVVITMQSSRSVFKSNIRPNQLGNGKKLTKSIVVITLIIGTIAERKSMLIIHIINS